MARVQYYNHDVEELVHPQKDKINKILTHGCLVKVNTDAWICRPIYGYNKTTYTLYRRPSGDFSCSCQGYNKKGTCSHNSALKLLLNEKQKQGTFF